MKNYQITATKSLNFLVFLFPLSFILGNFFINTLIVLISCLGIIHYKKELFIFDKKNPVILIIFFFIILILSTTFEFLSGESNSQIIKSITFLRYLFLLLVLRCMIIKSDLNLKKVLIISLIFSSFVASDVIFQFIVGYNIFGFKTYDIFPTSVFINEPIAGGYILKFFILGFFALPLIFNKNKFKLTSFSFIYVATCFLGTLFSSNRMPTILFGFLLILLIFFFLMKKFDIKKAILTFALVLFAVVLANKIPTIKQRYDSFLGAIQIFSYFKDEFKKDYPELEKYKNIGKPFHTIEELKDKREYYTHYPFWSGHGIIYMTSIDLIKDNLWLGNGIKSFRYKCREVFYKPNRVCQNHPHHFYLEILNDTGLVGLLLFLGGGLILVYKSLKKFIKKDKKTKEVYKLTFYACLFALLIDFFPLRSQGSFFSITSASYVFFLIGILLGLNDLKIKKNQRN